MPLLVADCPRCSALNSTFDVTAYKHIDTNLEVIHSFEVFSICRACSKSTVFVLKKKREVHLQTKLKPFVIYSKAVDKISDYNISLENIFDVLGFVSTKDMHKIAPPAYLPNKVENAFNEGAACYSIGCYNAAGAMFRLCIDLVSRDFLPRPDDTSCPQPDKRQRRDLGPRLAWLFDNGKLPTELKELAKAIREEGNDGAHAGNLSKDDIDDIIDFTTAFLERLITEPEKIRLAEQRRIARRASHDRPKAVT